MLPVAGLPMIEVLLSRLARAEALDAIVLATSVDPQNYPLVRHVEAMGFECFQGSESDVLSRYALAARRTDADIIVRITGDCPLVDPELVDEAVFSFRRAGVDYLCNAFPPTYPDGLDVEVFTRDALERAMVEAVEPFDREHVTSFLRNGKFSTTNILAGENLAHLRWTVDEAVDLAVINSVFNQFAPDLHFSWKEVWRLKKSNPAIFFANEHLVRNEGSVMGTGQKLWKRAKKIIPGGNMLLSKRAEMHLPDQWPAYFSKARGCQVWDLDGNHYIDMSLMGVGTNTLGYGHPEVDSAVLTAVRSGNMSTLNCAEEVYLAEKLVEIHPWAEMVRFARTGGEANAVAIRIARAAAGKDNVAVCGYHGWHDWYLSANLDRRSNLDGHLLPGLSPKGVPRELAGTVFPFPYNDFECVENLVREHDIGVIKMEVSRTEEPHPDFLSKIRSLASDNGIVLIFDECTSGFREEYGGLHKKYGIEPDMAIFGKALGNGYAITSVIGRRNVMQAAQSTFISSTFWTERIGYSAALAALDVMRELESWRVISETGKAIKNRWRSLARDSGIEIETWGLPALAGFTFSSPRALEYKTYLTQEMLKKGFLATTNVYTSIAHTADIVDSYFDALKPVFNVISECEGGQDINDLLQGPVCHSGFKRLN